MLYYHYPPPTWEGGTSLLCLDKEDKHRQDLIDMYETELQRQDIALQRKDAEIRLRHQLGRQQQPPTQLTQLQDEIKDLKDQFDVINALYCFS